MASISMAVSPKILGPHKRTTMMMAAPKPNMLALRSREWLVVARAAAPENKLSQVVEDSIKTAEEKCAESPESGECAAAWDEVEEVSAAASHARERSKAQADPLEKYCADNPETDECRTYDN